MTAATSGRFSPADVVYRVEGSRNLREWEDITSILFTRETALGPDGSLRRKTEVPDGDGYRFFRVRASPRD